MLKIGAGINNEAISSGLAKGNRTLLFYLVYK